MKNSSPATRLVLGGVVVVIAVALVWLTRAESPQRSTGTPDRGRPRAVSTARVQRTPINSLPNEQQRMVVDPPAMPDELVARVLEKDEKLALFKDYHKTVLLDAQRRDEYRRLLSDPDMMAAMAEGLMTPGSGGVSQEEYYRRLMQIDYFEAALTWKDNPQRQKLLALTGDIIAKDNFAGDENVARRQMLGGTKMELYRLLYEQDAGKAQQLVAQAKGTRMEPLVSWMAEEEIRRRTFEEELQQDSEEQQAKVH